MTIIERPATEPMAEAVGVPIAEIDNPELQTYKPWAKDRRFKPRLMSRWLSPAQLASAGLMERIAGTFEAFADRRETLAQREPVILMHPSLPGSSGPGRRHLFRSTLERDHSDDLWIDYVADVGDGFSSTYTVAAEIAMRDVAPKAKRYDVDPRAAESALDWGTDDRFDEAVLKRGDLLVMGGDQVYPLASDTEYRNRTVGPYEAACRYVAEEPMGLLAVPGNHDWYDGLTSFLGRFCSEGWIGGWQTRQTRSYWAAKLQEGWWMWGIDIGLEHTPIDHHQLEYFRLAAEELAEGDQIILVTSKPSWLMHEPSWAIGRRLQQIINGSGKPLPPTDYDQLSFFMTNVLAPHAANNSFLTPPRFAAVISGDKHYYCRYDRVPEESAADLDRRAIPHVVAGGGGAYLSLPYGLVDRVELPAGWRSTKGVGLRKAQQWPDVKATKRLGFKSIVRMIARNWGFCALLALLHLGMAAVLGFSEFTTSVDENFTRTFTELGSNPGWVAIAALLLAAGTAQLPTLRLWQRILVSLNVVVLQLLALAATAAFTVFAVENGLGFAPSVWAAAAVGVAALSWLSWAGRMYYYYNNWPSTALTGSAMLAIATGLAAWLLADSWAWMLILAGASSILAGAGFAISMLVAVGLFGVHGNMISVAVRESGYKNFLRLHIDKESNLHVYAIGFEQVPHQQLRWRVDGEAGDDGRFASETPEVIAKRPRGSQPFDTKRHVFEPRIIDAFTVRR